MSALSDAAVRYAELGLAVFPLHTVRKGGRCDCGNRKCENAGKHPLTRGWQRTIPSVTAVRDVWARADYGIGVACGAASGVFVLDVDVRHEGDEALAALVGAHGALPPTWVVRTGGMGTHVYFAWPSQGGVGNSASRVALGIDVRGQGGFVVMPPSPHVSGNVYGWVRAPEDIEIAQAPDWLIELTRKRRRAQIGHAHTELFVAGGERHAALVSLLGAMRRWGASEPVLDAAAVAFVRHQCKPDLERPIDWHHVHATATDIAMRYPPGM